VSWGMGSCASPSSCQRRRSLQLTKKSRSSHLLVGPVGQTKKRYPGADASRTTRVEGAKDHRRGSDRNHQFKSSELHRLERGGGDA